jgi:hypothetical protein
MAIKAATDLKYICPHMTLGNISEPIRPENSESTRTFKSNFLPRTIPGTRTVPKAHVIFIHTLRKNRVLHKSRHEKKYLYAACNDFHISHPRIRNLRPDIKISCAFPKPISQQLINYANTPALPTIMCTCARIITQPNMQHLHFAQRRSRWITTCSIRPTAHALMHSLQPDTLSSCFFRNYIKRMPLCAVENA